MQIQRIKRSLLRLFRDPPLLLALLFTFFITCPFIILGLSTDVFPHVWKDFLEGLLSVLQLTFGPIGIGMLVLGCTYNVAQTGLDQTFTNIKQHCIPWMSKFSSFVWDVEYALEQDMGKGIGLHYAKKIR